MKGRTHRCASVAPTGDNPRAENTLDNTTCTQRDKTKTLAAMNYGDEVERQYHKRVAKQYA